MMKKHKDPNRKSSRYPVAILFHRNHRLLRTPPLLRKCFKRANSSTKRQKTQFFSTYDATYVFKKLVEYFKSRQIECKLSDKNFKLEFEAVLNLTEDAVLSE